MKLISIVILSLLILGGCQKYNSEITTEELKASVTYLASDELKGRMTGDPELRLAANYLVQKLVNIGAKPLGNDSSGFFRYYPFISHLEVDGSTTLSVNNQALTLNSDYMVMPFSGNEPGLEHISLVFAGYGISLEGKNAYDDYKGLDVKGKVVLVLRNSPDPNNPHSEYSNHASFRAKTKTAQSKGAVAIFFVNTADESNDKFPEFTYDRAAAQDIPAFFISRKIVDGWLGNYKSDLTSIEKKINASKKSISIELKKQTISFATRIKYIDKPAFNVVGLLPGHDENLKNEYIVIGAHYDHWGMGGTGSLYRGEEPQIHNGADDNASGTAGIVELIEAFADTKHKRSIIFAAFSGEELGLLGSAALVKDFPVPIENVVMMANFDMIGRMDTNSSIILYGMGTSPQFKPMADSLLKNFSMKSSYKDEGFGPSDHSSFYSKNMPVLFFHTGLHGDYHRPSDDADKINYDGMKQVLDFSFTMINHVVNQPEKPEFKQAVSNTPRMRGFNVYIGTVPDYASNEKGMAISGVNPGSPAEKAGLKGGDLIVKIGNNSIENIYDYTNSLADLKADVTVELQYIRNKQLMKSTLTPEKKK